MSRGEHAAGLREFASALIKVRGCANYRRAASILEDSTQCGLLLSGDSVDVLLVEERIQPRFSESYMMHHQPKVFAMFDARGSPARHATGVERQLVLDFSSPTLLRYTVLYLRLSSPACQKIALVGGNLRAVFFASDDVVECEFSCRHLERAVLLDCRRLLRVSASNHLKGVLARQDVETASDIEFRYQ